MTQKITPLQYAIFLYEMTSEGREAEVAKLVKEFLAILAKNNDLGKINEIISEFKIYYKKQKGIKEVEILSAKPITKELKTRIVELMKQEGQIELKEKVDPELLGGITLIIGDKMIDGSLRRKLRELSKLLSYG